MFEASRTNKIPNFLVDLQNQSKTNNFLSQTRTNKNGILK